MDIQTPSRRPTLFPNFPAYEGRLPIGAASPWLAPLAGFSDLPFRLVCRSFGASVACTEMVSAKGLIYGLRQKKQDRNGTEDLLVTTPEDAPLVIQIFGEDPDFIAAAVQELRGRGARFFDLNMGCSVPKVAKTGAGSALMQDPALALRAAKALLDNAEPGCAGCKIRLGWDTPVYLELAQELEQNGAAWITLHPRFARQAFSGMADTSAFEKLAKVLSVPIIASGDLFTAEDAIARLEQGAQGVMFARGAMAAPWIFQRYHALLRGDAAPEFLAAQELLDLILYHADLARRLTPGRPGPSGRTPALLKMRTVVPRYVRHLPGIKQLRQDMSLCNSWDALREILLRFFAPFGVAVDESLWKL